MPEHSQHTATTSRITIIFVVIVLAIIIAGVYHVRDTTAFVDATTHQPERYSELYFANSNQLPANIVHDKTVPVSFSVHNVEARNTSYPYQVSLISDAGKTIAQTQGNFSLPNNGTKTINSTIQVPNYRGRAEVQVLLTNLHQSIHFWVQSR